MGFKQLHPWWSLHHPHLSVPYIFPVILNMQNISVSLRKVPGFKDSNSISVSFNFFAKRKVKRKEKRCNSRKVIALPNSLTPVGPRNWGVVVVRSLVLFVLDWNGKPVRKMEICFQYDGPLKGFVFCVCVSLDTYVDAYINIFTHTMYTYTYLIESVNGSSVAGVLFFVLQPCRNLGMSTYFLDSHLQVCL